MDDDAIKQMFDGLEDQVNAERLQRQGAFAVTAAKITGLVFTEAVASGVPASLAQEMATDSWMALMGFEALTVAAENEDGES